MPDPVYDAQVFDGSVYDAEDNDSTSVANFFRTLGGMGTVRPFRS